MTPRPYQIEGRDFLAGRRHALLADEMRIGKTGQAILAAHQRGAQSLLAVCPAIARTHWRREIERWWPGEKLPRFQVWSWDEMRNNWQSGLRGSVDVLIPDECHFAVNPEAARTVALYGKDGYCRQAGAVWPLSGTPAPRHAGQLWTMMYTFGIVGLHYGDFIRRYCRCNAMGQPVGTKVSMIPELKDLLAKFMLRRTRKQVAPDMPDIDYQFLEVDPVGVDIGAVPIGADADWLEQHASADREDRIAVAFAKVDPLVAEIEFAINNGLLKQTVVFGWHREPLLQLVAVLREHGIRADALMGGSSQRFRDTVQGQFRDGYTHVIGAQILAAGTAIDLSVASHGYFLELDWVSGNNVQAANRLVSMDKAEPVTFDVVTWPGSRDDHVQQVLLQRVRELSKLFS